MKLSKITLALILTAIYDYLFWSHGWGLNIIIFDAAAIPLMMFFNKESLVKRQVWFATAGTVLTALLTVVNGSDTAKISHLLSFSIMTGFIHQSELKTVYNAFLTALADILQAPVNYLEEFNKHKSKNIHLKRISSFIRLCIIPLLILSVFYWIFKFANPVFDQLSSKAWDVFYDFIGTFFSDLSFSRLFFLLSGLFVVSSIVFRGSNKGFLNFEHSATDAFRRIKPSGRRASFGKIYKEFKNEFRVGLLTIAMVNALLLVVNIIDVKSIWFEFEYSQGFDLSQFVHEGTYFLILSILISIGIILYFFRGNINLLKNNKSLKILAYVWIFQNALLAFSVAIRNYYYIEQCGLAYKRIGVVVFLLLVLIGLITLFVKISSVKSTFYLFRINSWAIYIVMLMISMVNWDLVIASHNMSRADKITIDRDFLLTLSDKTLYLLHKNRELFPAAPMKTRDYPTYEKFLEDRTNAFIINYKNRSWQSFNLADHNCYEELVRNNIKNK